MLFLGLLSFVLNGLVALASPASERRAESFVGYLLVHFYDREPSIFLHLSDGNNPLSYRPLNDDKAILVPTVGSESVHGVRDPYIISRPDQSKHYIIATDLNIDDINQNWDYATRHGSLGIVVWESDDLVHWSDNRLVQIMPPTGGMTWAPEAVWDYEKEQFLVVWSSRLYDEADVNHTGTATEDQIFYAHTSDFVTFTKAAPYVAIDGTPVIDLTFLSMDSAGRSYARFIKDENVLRVWEERSDTGLFGNWTRVGSKAYIDNVVSEGPLVFWDNEVEGRAYLFLDQYTTARGYVPFVTENVDAAEWSRVETTGLPALLKHGVVKPVTQTQYDLLQSTWG